MLWPTIGIYFLTQLTLHSTGQLTISMLRFKKKTSHYHRYLVSQSTTKIVLSSMTKQVFVFKSMTNQLYSGKRDGTQTFSKMLETTLTAALQSDCFT